MGDEERTPSTFQSLPKILGGSLLVSGFIAIVICFSIEVGSTNPAIEDQSLFQSSKKTFFMVWAGILIPSFIGLWSNRKDL